MESWSRTESFIMHMGYILTNMPKVVILNIFWMDIMHPNVHIQTCLNIVSWNAFVFEILACLS